MKASDVVRELRKVADPSYAVTGAWFFKTGEGQYGAGDVFIGVRVPEQRKIARRFAELPLPECERLLGSEVHEDRLTALLILVGKFGRSGKGEQRAIYDLYMSNRQRVNNWDLVDSSAPQIAGGYLQERSRAPLYRLARSRFLWDRRIAILATQRFIRTGDFHDALRICEMLLADTEDLIHKAVGWMLREVGGRDRKVLTDFLDRHGPAMPRTMLRYAIEKLPEPLRKHYLNMGR